MARSSLPADIAPMPADPTRCRWCLGRLIALIDGEPANYCQAGCARNDSAPYLRDCRECNQAFKTGDPRAVLCAPCDDRELRQVAAMRSTTPRHERSGKDYTAWYRERAEKRG